MSGVFQPQLTVSTAPVCHPLLTVLTHHVDLDAWRISATTNRLNGSGMKKKKKKLSERTTIGR